MGADGGVYYFKDTKEYPFLTQLLTLLIDWLCSDDCSFDFDGTIFVKDDMIYIKDDNGKTEPLLSKGELKFITKIRDHIVDFCGTHQYHHENMMTWDEFHFHQKTDFNFDFRADFDDLLNLTRDLNQAWNDANGLWFYWDTSSFYHTSPFEEEGFEAIMKVYQECKDDDKFSQVFSNEEQFMMFINTLPTPDYIQVWT